MTNPLIQIDDEVREMTDEEYAQYLQVTANPSPLPKATDETPSTD
jgi:hypothetical protein